MADRMRVTSLIGGTSRLEDRQEQSLSIPTTMHTVATIVAYLEQFAPPALAADWDNVGLLLGERGAEVRRVLTCLTVTPESAAEAIETEAQLLITHHPILVRAITRPTD